MARDFRAKEPVPEAWSKAPEVKEPSADEYLDAIEAGLAKDRAQERSLRLLAWWRGNDSSGTGGLAAEAHPAASPDGFRRNLLRFADLLTDDTDNDRVMKAEVLRELGQFKAAQAALGKVASRDFDWVVERIRTLCKARNPTVAKLTGLGAPRPRSEVLTSAAPRLAWPRPFREGGRNAPPPLDRNQLPGLLQTRAGAR